MRPDAWSLRKAVETKAEAPLPVQVSSAVEESSPPDRIPEVNDLTHTPASCEKAPFSGVRIQSSSDPQGGSDPEEEREGVNNKEVGGILWVAHEVSGEALQRKYHLSCILEAEWEWGRAAKGTPVL